MMKRIVGYAFSVWLGGTIGLTPGMVLGWGDWPVFIGVPMMGALMFLWGAFNGIRLTLEEVQGEDK